MIFGFNLGATISSKIRLINVMMLELYDIDAMFGVFLLGSLVGVFLGGRLVSETGRIYPMIGGFAFGVLGQLGSMMSPNMSTLLISEFAVGSSFGVYLIAVVCYIAEISLPQHRGAHITLIAVFFTLGLFVSVSQRSNLMDNRLLCMVIIAAVSFVIILYGLLRMPESPRYLVLSGANDKALLELIVYRDSKSAAARELAAINECSLGEEKGLLMFLKSHIYRSIIWFLLLLSALVQLSGITVMPYFSLDFIESCDDIMLHGFFLTDGDNINFSELELLIFAAFIGAVVTMCVVDGIGRKKLFLGAVILNELVLCCMYTVFYLDLTFVGEFSFVLLFFLYIFSASIISILFLIILSAELLTIKGREFGLTVLYLVNLIAILVGIEYLYVAVQEFGILMVLSLILLGGALVFSLVYVWLPETSGKMLESMENTIFNEKSLLSIDKIIQ